MKDLRIEKIGGLLDKKEKSHQCGSIFNRKGLSPSITTGWGNAQPFVIDRYGSAKHIQKRFERAADNQEDELDVYMELIEGGATIADFEAAGVTNARDFIAEHGLL